MSWLKKMSYIRNFPQLRHVKMEAISVCRRQQNQHIRTSNSSCQSSFIHQDSSQSGSVLDENMSLENKKNQDYEESNEDVFTSMRETDVDYEDEERERSPPRRTERLFSSIRDFIVIERQSRVPLCMRSCFKNIGHSIKELFSPSITHNNVKLLGSKQAVEKEKERSKQGYTIHPLSNFRQFWDLFVMFVMLINLFVLPLDVAFNMQAIDSFLTVSDVMCMFDIIFNFRTGYILFPNSKYFELNGKLIAKHYLKTWFIIDLIGILPLQHVVIGFCERNKGVSLSLKSASHALKYWKVFKLIRLLKLLRVSRIIRSVMMYEMVYRITTGLVRYIKLVLLMMITAHWNGCIHFLVPMLQGFPDNCWVRLCQVEHSEWYIQYGWAIFKTLSHMLCIGYGQFIPRLLSEALLTIFTMVTGATFYALFIANSMAYMIETDYSKITFREKRKRTKEYLACRHIPDSLKQRVDAYFNQKYSHERYFEENEVLSQISKPIREDIVRHICADLINNLELFEFAPPQVISKVLETVTSDTYLPDDVIVCEGRKGSELYFIRDGEVRITVNGITIETLQKGDLFGEINFLLQDQYLYTATASIVCEVVVLSDEFYATSEEDVNIRSLLEHAAIKRIFKIYHQCIKNMIEEHEGNLSKKKVIQTDLPNHVTLLKKIVKSLLNHATREGTVARLSSLTTDDTTRSEALVALIVFLAQIHKKGHDHCDIPISIEQQDVSSCTNSSN